MRALDDALAAGVPVGMQTGVFWLPYFPRDMRFQFNGHHVIAYGKEADEYLLSDTVFEAPVRCHEADLRRARFSKGPLAPKGLLYRIVGVEQSPEMLARARERVASARWRNVTLLCSPVESAPLEGWADAALFHFTHDILRRPEAVANVVRHLKPGARVVATGLKWARGLARPVNLFVLPAAWHSVTTLEGLGQPWSHLAAQVGRLEVESLLMGAVFIASGRLAARA